MLSLASLSCKMGALLTITGMSWGLNEKYFEGSQASAGIPYMLPIIAIMGPIWEM